MKRVFMVLVLLSGCAAPPPASTARRDPTLEEWNTADFGDEPENYDAAIRSYMDGTLQDPNGATVTIMSGPRKTWIGEYPNFRYGYGLCVLVDDKGVSTAYTNFGPTFFFFVNGKVVEMRTADDAQRLCERLGQSPAGESATY